MSYPINQAITYTAVASTTGLPSDTFAYAWSFDDGGNGATASITHTWTTVGDHSATVTATDNQTHGTGTTSKTINIADWTTKVWVSTGLKIIAATSATFSNRSSQATRMTISGDYIVNWQDQNNSTTITTFNTVTNIRTEYPSIMSALGAPATAITLDLGPNAGKVLIVGASTAKYAFFDPVSGALTISPNPTPYTFNGPPTITTPIAKTGDGKLFIHGFINGPTIRCMSYDQVNDSWVTRNGAGTPTIMSDLFRLPSGNLISVQDNDTQTFIYNYVSDSWSSGPTLPINYPLGVQIAAQDNNLRIVGVELSTTPRYFSWGEGEGAFSFGTNNYPFLSQSGVGTGTSWKEFVITPDGSLINVGGNTSTGFGDTPDIKSIYYFKPNDAWIVGTNYNSSGTAWACGYVNGKIWRAGANGVLEYLVW